MYGTVSSQSSAAKTTSMAAVCGFAAVFAVAGLVGFVSQPTALYSATAVRPAVQASTVAAVPVATVRGAASTAMAAAPAAYIVAEETSQATFGSQVSGFWPIALGVTAMTALVSAVLRKKQAVSMEPIAMAATSGERLVWLPGATPPAHLTGQYPGDRGFDPLGLSKEPKTFERMRISEVFHGRLAMLGVVGCLFPELLLHKASWFEAWSSVDQNKFGLLAMQCIAPVEYWRGNGGFGWKGNDAGLDRSYPGFDPLGITTEDTKLREIKNGRLAMTAMLGFAVQHQVTGQSPLANLSAHLADPFHANAILGSVAMFSTSGKKERPLWFPGGYAPAWLSGEYPGDRGFDPAALAADPKTYARMRISEVFHGRLAMLAVVGAITQEFLGKGAWYDAPANAGMGLQQLAVAIGICGLPEFFRGQGGFSKDQTDKSYPGFDPLKLTTDYTKEAEIKNGRLALTAIAGFAVQHQVTGKSPIQDFVAHWYNPLGANIAANLAHAPVAMFATAGHKDGVWFPGAKPAAHLTGEYPADRGFDPLGLAVEPTTYARMRISEVFHGRCAMLGVVGCIVPELLGKGAWFDAGNSVNGYQLGFLAMAIAAPTEYWRGQGGFGWDKGTMDQSYPGFDPLKLTTDRTKVAEIKNGRLAMAAIAGFAAQAKLTGQSPLAALAAHLSNPVGANIITSHTSLAMF